jgi:hypothetical protein
MGPYKFVVLQNINIILKLLPLFFPLAFVAFETTPA